MAQGKEWTAKEKDDIIQSLKPYLEAGLSRNKACDAIGLPPQTLSNWVQGDVALGMKLKSWEDTISIQAISNIASAIQTEAELEDTRKDTSKWWLERRKKEDFSTRTEATGADGKDLLPVLVKFSDGDNSTS